MIPPLVNGVLPPGIHDANLQETAAAFAWNEHRRTLLAGFRRGLAALRWAGCSDVWLDGSYVTEKQFPNDFDACWEVFGVDVLKLDPVLLKLEGKRLAQKAKYGGEFLPNVTSVSTGFTFVDFFQRDRNGELKGILHIDVGEWT